MRQSAAGADALRHLQSGHRCENRKMTMRGREVDVWIDIVCHGSGRTDFSREKNNVDF
jgi:hypothetical protein